MVNEETQIQLMHFVIFGRGEGLPYQAAHSVPKGTVPALHPDRPAALLTDHLVLACGHHLLARFPKITKRTTRPVVLWDTLPEGSTTLPTSVTDKKRHHLPRPTT
jgi:hypothetical protein